MLGITPSSQRTPGPVGAAGNIVAAGYCFHLNGVLAILAVFGPADVLSEQVPPVAATYADGHRVLDPPGVVQNGQCSIDHFSRMASSWAWTQYQRGAPRRCGRAGKQTVTVSASE